MLRVCLCNRLLFRYVLTDNRFSSKETMKFIKAGLSKDFVMAVKSDRTVALSSEEKKTVILFRQQSRL